MERKTPKTPTKQTREDRLKAALKANLSRRKAQIRARSDITGQNRQTDENKD